MIMCTNKKGEVSQTHLDEHLTNCFVGYLIAIKENGDALGYTRVQTALFTALGGLDKDYNTPQFVGRMRDDFELIARHLDSISHNMYKEERIKEVYNDRNSPQLEKTYTVVDIAKKLNITEQAVRKSIKVGNLKAQKVRNSYHVTHNDLEDFIKNRKRK